MNYSLPVELLNHYNLNKDKIQDRLVEFSLIKPSEYFYEFCFCLMTPQSKAENALRVQSILQEMDFRNSTINPVDILNDKQHYIRFHNQKAKRLIWLRDNFFVIEDIIKSNMNIYEIRNKLAETVNGIGMKEAGHFLRNIGRKNLAILDRHILNTMKQCNIFDEIPNISNRKVYLETEQKFLEFADQINIPIDELDLLFFSYQNGKILK